MQVPMLPTAVLSYTFWEPGVLQDPVLFGQVPKTLVLTTHLRRVIV